MLTPENQQLLERMKQIDAPTFEKALLTLFNLIDDQAVIEYIAGEFQRGHEEQKRTGTLTLSPLAVGALIAILDNITFGHEFVVDHATMQAHMRSRSAALN
jgi:hypothetical protein